MPASTPPRARPNTAVGVGNERVADVVEKVLDNGHFSLNLGGDHAMAIGSIGYVLCSAL